MPPQDFSIEDEIDRILSQKNPKIKFRSLARDSIRNAGLRKGQADAVSGLRNWGTLVDSGNEDSMAIAYQGAQSQLQNALQNGSPEDVAFWSSALGAVSDRLTSLYPEEDDGSGANDNALALANLYDTAVNVGTMKGSAADKKLSAALDQAKFKQDRPYVAGFEPYGAASNALWGPMGGIGDAGKYTKVEVPEPNEITDAANSGFNEALAALLGARGGSGGGGGAGLPASYAPVSGSGGYGTPQGSATATATAALEGAGGGPTFASPGGLDNPSGAPLPGNAGLGTGDPPTTDPFGGQGITALVSQWLEEQKKKKGGGFGGYGPQMPSLPNLPNMPRLRTGYGWRN